MKTILVTGAGRGIGRAVATAAGARGCNVGVNYLQNEAAARETADAVVQAGGRVVLLKGDTAFEADVAAMFDELSQHFGVIDGVVVNAGIAASASSLADMDVSRLKRMFEVNVLGAYLCAREAARRLPRDRGGNGGSIVLVSSVASQLGSPGEYVDYAGSKGAVDTLAIGLAKELAGQGVRVNAIRPGVIETEIHGANGEPGRAVRVGKLVPMGRAGRAEEVADAVMFLLSDAASYITGTFLNVSGGR